jgi:hypothetical protein
VQMVMCCTTFFAGPDVLCVAKNDAVLSGLLTVFHAERSFDTVANVQVGGTVTGHR